LVPLPVFAIIEPLCPQPNHAGIAQLQLVITLDKGLHSLFTALFAYFTFHKKYDKNSSDVHINYSKQKDEKKDLSKFGVHCNNIHKKSIFEVF
jgi:hypothetical protein